MSIWLFSSVMRLPLWTSFRNTEISTPCLVARCLSSEPRFASMSTGHCRIVHRLHGHGAPHHRASVHLPHPHHHYHHHDLFDLWVSTNIEQIFHLFSLKPLTLGLGVGWVLVRFCVGKVVLMMGFGCK